MRTAEEILRAQRRRNNVRECVAGLAMGAVWGGCIAGMILYTGGDAEAAEAVIPETVQEYAEEIGEEYGICPELLEAIAYHESGCNKGAIGGGCVGLMQISERWHTERMERLGVTDLMDGRQNMTVAADYLSELFTVYDDPGMVLMVYNGDSDAQAYYHGEAELSEYAADILELSEQLEREHGK